MICAGVCCACHPPRARSQGPFNLRPRKSIFSANLPRVSPMTGRQRSRGRFDSSAQQIAATTFGHAFSNTGQEAGSITNITFSPGQLASTVVYRVLTLPASSALNPFGTKANLVYSFPDVGPEQVDVDTITYRLFGDVRGTAAGRPSTCRWIDTASSSRTTSFRQRRPAVWAISFQRFADRRRCCLCVRIP